MRSQRPEQCGEVAYSTLLLISYLQLIFNPIIYAYMNNGDGTLGLIQKLKRLYHTTVFTSQWVWLSSCGSTHIFTPFFRDKGELKRTKKNAPMQIKFETSKFAAIFFPCITKTYLSSQGRQGYSSFFFLFRFLFWFDTIINPIVNSIRSQLRHTTKCCLMINQAEKSSSAVKAKIGTPRDKDKKSRKWESRDTCLARCEW